MSWIELNREKPTKTKTKQTNKQEE